ncbi:MAG: ATP-binding protein [Acidobacteriota bacterium]|nr:ATP-binding protein [Acidobacteriota bacterium]
MIPGVFRRLPLRFRLMLWYLAALLAGTATFAAIVYEGLSESLIASRRTAVSERMNSLQRSIREEGPVPGLDGLKEQLAEFSDAMPPEFRIRLIDPSGADVFTSKPKLLGPLIGRSEPLVVDGKQYQLDLTATLRPTEEILERLRGVLLLSIPVAILLAAAGGFWTTRRALFPIREMAQAARSIGSDNLSVRLPVPEPNDELRHLAVMWNGMLGRLEAAVNRNRQFTADASHDLRTPLAILRAAAEIALRRKRAPEEYEEALQCVLRQADRATGLVECLLTLARADASLADWKLGAVELNPLLADAVEALEPVAQTRNLALALELPCGPVWVRADSAAMHRLIAILIDNAVKNTETGSIHVRLTTEDNAAVVSVEDPGRGISERDLPHVFDRFYRGDKSRGSRSGGSGLGLSIAKWIAESHGGEISLVSRLGAGTKVFVRLPKTT